jgi:hypothetical protein
VDGSDRGGHLEIVLGALENFAMLRDGLTSNDINQGKAVLQTASKMNALAVHARAGFAKLAREESEEAEEASEESEVLADGAQVGQNWLAVEGNAAGTDVASGGSEAYQPDTIMGDTNTTMEVDRTLAISLQSRLEQLAAPSEDNALPSRGVLELERVMCAQRHELERQARAYSAAAHDLTEAKNQTLLAEGQVQQLQQELQNAQAAAQRSLSSAELLTQEVAALKQKMQGILFQQRAGVSVQGVDGVGAFVMQGSVRRIKDTISATCPQGAFSVDEHMFVKDIIRCLPAARQITNGYNESLVPQGNSVAATIAQQMPNYGFNVALIYAAFGTSKSFGQVTQHLYNHFDAATALCKCAIKANGGE